MKGIDGAFDEIYEKYAKMLYGYALQLCQNPSTADDILQSMIKKEESTGIYKEIHTLKEPYKEVLLLRIMGCLSFQQIGEIFGKSETWGRVTFHRAKEKIKKQIGDE